MPNLLNRMQNNEGWLTNLSPGVVSQSKITLANHLHHKEKRRLYKTLAYILRIGIDGVITHNGKRDKKQYHFVFDIIFRTDVGA